MQLVLPIFALLVSVDASARILVTKNFVSKYPVAQQENVFRYQLVNVGDVTAIDVELSDRDSFPTDKFEILKGSSTAKFAGIPPNGTASHHIIVIPRASLEIQDKDVIVEYTDSETKAVSRVSNKWHKNQFTHFYPKDALKKLNRSTHVYFLAFAGMTLPLTVLSALFQWRSKCRYSIKKQC